MTDTEGRTPRDERSTARFAAGRARLRASSGVYKVSLAD
jgi:hypothetical protein